MKHRHRKCPRGTGCQGWVGCNGCVWRGKGVPGAGEPPLTLTGPNLLIAEGAELGFYFHELALQGNTLTEETSWKGVCGLGLLSAGEGERLGS